MRMPRSVKVGHLTYRVERMTRRVANAGKMTGDCDVEGQRIRIKLGLSPASAAETLMHEIMHAVWWGWGIPDPTQEEPCVRSLATGLACVMRDSPALRRYLAEALA